MTVALVCLATALGNAAAQADPAPVHAIRGTPDTDGLLDDAAWQSAPWTEPFRQRVPANGARGTHRTRARILYDARAIYIAIDAETGSRPEARLARRDAIPAGEWVRVMIDARGEGASAFSFTVNPAGVQSDAIVQGDDEFDAAWDALWRVETHVTDRGWTAEFRIPWRILRFDTARLAFKVQIDRSDFDAGETVALVPIAASAPRFVARFAPLLGISNVSSGRVLELRPYVLGRLRALSDPGRLDATRMWSGTLGLDLKLGITNDLVLDATVNPDFGQVELDPAVINLGTFEVFFPERRPFFLEGTDLFHTPIRVLHTRRIGAAPGVPSPVHPGGVIESVDPLSSIFGALKVTGRVGPLSVMILDAVTAPAFARERYTDAYGNTVIAPLQVSSPTNWLAARVRGSTGPGSIAGAMFTHVGRFDRPNDTVGGVDWDFRAPDGIHRFRGQFVATQAWNENNGTHSGQGLYLEAARAEDPVFVWSLRAKVFSRDFDPNGLGYLERANLINFVIDPYFRTPRPFGPIRRIEVNPYVWRTTNMDGLLIDQGMGLEGNLSSRDLWTLGAGAAVNSQRFDDRETRGGLPFQLDPSGSAFAWVNSDSRKRFRVSLSGDFNTQNGGHRAGAYLGLSWIPVPRASLSWSLSVRSVTNVPRWVANEVDATGMTHAVFGQQRAQIYDASLRASLSFSRRAAVDLYSQLLFASIRYEDYRELTAPDRLVPYAYAGNADYDRVSLVVNAVARYEYLPQSFLTIVLIHRQSLAAGNSAPGFDTGLGLVGYASPDTLLMAKLTYLLL